MKLVLIEWVDSAQPLSAWCFLDDLPASDVVHCRSVGWLVGNSRDVKILAPNIGDLKGGGSAQGSGFIRIPSKAITRLVELREVKNERRR